MQTGKVIISSLVGTSAMTLFSYLASGVVNKNFREPEILGQLANRLPHGASKKYAQVVGWCAHYATGILFEVVFSALWKRKKIKPSTASGAVLGAASGLAGVIVWKGVFEAHPNPPPKDLKRFFGHLVLAHVVFGVFSALTYKLAEGDENV